MRELVPGFENLNSRGARVDGGAFISLSPVSISKNDQAGFGEKCHLIQNINSRWVDVGLGWSTLRTEYASHISELAATRTCSSV